jgi:hypothetical protein
VTTDFGELVKRDFPPETGRQPGVLVQRKKTVPVAGRDRRPVYQTLEHLNDGARMNIMRGDKVVKGMRLGPNSVHAYITHPDGSVDDLGENHNQLTNIGRDWWADGLGAQNTPGGQGSPLTGAATTSATCTATPWTSSNYGTGPVLGLGGCCIVVPVTGLTTTPVMGLIGSNTTSVATIDQWWTPLLAGTGTTPANTSAFYITPGRLAGAMFMALTTNSATSNATSTSLLNENAANGVSRTKATYTHTYGVATFTMVVAYSITGTITALHKMALFTCSTTAAGGIEVFEAVLNVDATVANLDTLTVTDTITLSG